MAFVAATRHLALLNDPADYQRLAVSLARHNTFGHTVIAPAGGPTAFRPPLFPLTLAAVYKVAGVHLGAARVVEALFGVVTVGLVGVLAHRVATRRVALVAMAIAAVYPSLVLAGGSLLSESIALPLELGAVLAAWRASSTPSRWAVRAGVAGLLTGLAILNRPNSALTIVALVLLAAIGRRGLRRVAPPAVLVVVAVVVVVPWLVRDLRVMHHFVPLTTQAGLVASGTYNDTAAHDRRAPAAWRPPNLVPEYHGLLHGDEYHEERRLRHAALRYVQHHPTYVLRVVGWNTARLFGFTGPQHTLASWTATGISRGWGAMAYWAWWPLAGLAIGGAFTRSARSAPRAIWLVPVLLWLSAVPLLSQARLRAPIDCFLVVLAALAVDSWWLQAERT